MTSSFFFVSAVGKGIRRAQECPTRCAASGQEKFTLGWSQISRAVATHERVLYVHAAVVSVEIILIDAQREPTLADAALHRDECEILSVHLPVSLFAQSLGIESNVWVFLCRLCGISVPATFGPLRA
jgi:hypothetical protein